MNRFILGTAGHIDHGKTELIKALTGVDTDRLPEEKAKGISIELGFAPLKLKDDLLIGIVDVPGHEKFVANMIAGATGIDIVLLCVAADEGIKPQTVEHVNICNLLGIKKGLISLTRSDLADSLRKKEAKDKIRTLLKDSNFDTENIIETSAKTFEGIDELKKIIADSLKGLERKNDFGSFRLNVDRVFPIKGFGTVVTGTSLRGRVSVGDKLSLCSIDSGTKEVVVRGLRSFDRAIDTAISGERLALNLSGVEVKDVKRGDVLSVSGNIKPVKTFDAFLKGSKNSKVSVKQNQTFRIAFGTRETECSIKLLSDKKEKLLEPEEGTFVRVILKGYGFLEFGEKFILRNPSPTNTIGGGVVLDLNPTKRITDTEHYIDELKIMVRGELKDVILVFLGRSRLKGIKLQSLIDTLNPKYESKDVEQKIEELVSSNIIVKTPNGGELILQEGFTSLMEEIKRQTSDYHSKKPMEKGVGIEEIRKALGRITQSAILEQAVKKLIESGEIIRDSDKLKMPGEGTYLSPGQKVIVDKIDELLLSSKNTPPSLKEISRIISVHEPKLKDYLKLMMGMGSIVKVNESLYYHSSVIKDLERSLVGIIKNKGSISVLEFKDLSKTSRKYSIPLLEYFDKNRITLRRKDDRRVLGTVYS